MQVSVAKGPLTGQVRHAEAGEAIAPTRTVPNRRAVLDAVRQSAAGKSSARPKAERSQDFLYGEDGLPT